MTYIESSLLPGARAGLVRTIPASKLISIYQSDYGIDVSRYFQTDVEVYECERTGFRFYYPYSLAGEEDLYVHLQQFPWNYKGDKWEYRRAIEVLRIGTQVLDVGCGEGGFITLAAEAGMVVEGLELNRTAIAVARKSGLRAAEDRIEDRAQTQPGYYDAVCSFQVLEHVPNVREFITACIKALKPGGRLIFGVPNNDSFMRYVPILALNSPPHHMGLWTGRSLSALAEIFPLKLISLECEPLSEIDWFSAVMIERHLPIGISSLYHKSGLSSLVKKVIKSQARRIPGHTILAIFEKKATT